MRVGLGTDAHALVEGVPLVLGGVELDSAHGLAGNAHAQTAVKESVTKP